MGADDLERIVRGAGHPSTTGAVASTVGASSVVRTLSPQGPARQTQQQPLQIRTCGGSHELAPLAAENVPRGPPSMPSLMLEARGAGSPVLQTWQNAPVQNLGTPQQAQGLSSLSGTLLPVH